LIAGLPAYPSVGP
jgi:hypothetical protein